MAEVRETVFVDRDRRWAVVVAIAGTVAVAGFAVLAALQILVLNPLAAVPGATLDQIRTELAAAGESLGTPGVLVVMALGVAFAAGLLVLTLRGRLATRRVGRLYLVLLVLGTPAYWMASFGGGMSLADTYGISGADYSPWAMPLFLTSGAALLALVLIAGVRVLKSLRSRPAAA